MSKIPIEEMRLPEQTTAVAPGTTKHRTVLALSGAAAAAMYDYCESHPQTSADDLLAALLNLVANLCRLHGLDPRRVADVLIANVQLC